MKELNTPFGKLYIDSWNPRERPEEDRIVIYDSRKDFLDYFSFDYFYDGVDEDSYFYAEQEYNELCKMLEKGGEQETIYGFIDWLGVSFYYAGTNREEALDALSQGCAEELSEEDLETNTYVNHIGDNYIVIAEC